MKTYKRTCKICNEIIESISQQKCDWDYVKHYEKCRVKLLKEVERKVRKRRLEGKEE